MNESSYYILSYIPSTLSIATFINTSTVASRSACRKTCWEEVVTDVTKLMTLTHRRNMDAEVYKTYNYQSYL